MKYRMMVHHLPTDSVYYSMAEEFTELQIEQTKQFLRDAAAGKFTYVKFDGQNNMELYFPSEILAQSVLALEVVYNV